MENLNAEQIVKALECCGGDIVECQKCAYVKNGYGKCKECAAQDALSLIKELTEENANLHASCTELERKCASLNDAYERLRVVADMSDTALTDALRIVNEFCDKRVKRATADTVRKMQEKVKAFLTGEETNFVIAEGEVFIPISAIKKITKEMVEGEDEHKED